MVPEIKMIIKNEYGQIIDHNIVEAREWHLVAHYVKEHHQILELGARYGSASIACNKIINDKSKQVSVEPDPTVWKSPLHKYPKYPYIRGDVRGEGGTI
jgi:hypothetical protein